MRLATLSEIGDRDLQQVEVLYIYVINKGFPNHATFREKGAKLACADKLGVFLSLTLCNEANFDPLQRVKYDGLGKM